MPVMSVDLNTLLGTAEIISMVIAGSTIVSSLLSGAMLHRFGTGKLRLSVSNFYIK